MLLVKEFAETISICRMFSYHVILPSYFLFHEGFEKNKAIISHHWKNHYMEHIKVLCELSVKTSNVLIPWIIEQNSLVSFIFDLYCVIDQKNM